MAVPAWADDLKAAFSALSATVVSNHAVVISRLDALDARVGALDARVGGLETAVGALDARVGGLETAVSALDARGARVEASMLQLVGARANDVARLANALKACEAPLRPLPYGCDGRPWPADVAQPATLLDLAVSGAEAKPGTNERADWCKKRSRAFLHAAVDGYATDGTDGEGEIGSKARTARVKVIQAMGGDVAAVLATTYKFS